ncbi:MAG: hypothetical protein KF893_14675 [Caldilineaceae bacterium]|nr:hypothetical protein [Caldilineaceae bacterium]
MGKLATKPHLAASLNIMVASRQVKKSARNFSNEEIVEILLAMAENDSVTERGHKQHWQQDRRAIN